MKKIKVITDSTAYFTREEKETYGISIVPLTYIVNNKVMKEGFPEDYEDFFKELEKGDLTITTSQPAVGDFLSLYEEAFNEGYDEIVVVVLSSKLSGAFNSANLAKNSLGDKMITVIDSETAAGNLKFLVLDALDLVEKGKTANEIEAYINLKKKDLALFLTVGDLKYLNKSGRLSKAKSLVGNLLRIKPILTLEGGSLEVFDKTRGRKQAMGEIFKNLPKNAKKIIVCHILAAEEAEELRRKIKEKYNNIEVSIGRIGPTIGGHLGPKSIGVCIYI